MNKLKKQVKGITLLALVVTIIVLLILAAVATRLALGDGGVIDEARTVANEWDKATEKEQSDLAKVAQEMRQARNGIYNGTSGNQTGDGDVAGAKDTIEKITGNETENTETTDKNGNKIVVPAGFKVVNPTDDVTAGIIIEDVSANDDYSKGNQYVWIPVSHVNGEKTNTIKDSNGVEHTIELARYIFNTDGTVKTKITDGSVLDTYFREETIAEHTASKYNNFIAKDINTFKESVKSNGGYYFARYEAGDPTTETNRQSSSLQTVVPVFKNNQVAYDYIAQRNAAERTRELYTNQSTNYISDLINSYSWDTTLIFIQEFSGDPDYSMQGCLQLNTSARTGQATDGENKDVRCNIYDMAGNVREASTETMYNPAPGVSRGGIYLNNNLRASGRANQVATSIIVSEGFRRNYIHFK